MNIRGRARIIMSYYLVTVTYAGGSGRICNHETLDDVHAWLANHIQVAKVSGSVINRIKIVRIETELLVGQGN